MRWTRKATTAVALARWKPHAAFFHAHVDHDGDSMFAAFHCPLDSHQLATTGSCPSNLVGSRDSGWPPPRGEALHQWRGASCASLPVLVRASLPRASEATPHTALYTRHVERRVCPAGPHGLLRALMPAEVWPVEHFGRVRKMLIRLCFDPVGPGASHAAFQLAETSGYMQVDLERYCHVNERFRPGFFGFYLQ
jgi:hypothetical protein